MDFKELDTVVLIQDLPERRLRAGDVGAVVQVYAPDRLEVEFVTAGGHTEAVLELRTSDVRKAKESDLITVRPRRRGAA